MIRPQIVGIVNITTDSFSDGGKFVTTEAAIAQAEKLLTDGADILDLGAASSNPNAQPVSAETEIARLAPVIAHLKQKRARISVDTTKPEVQRFALAQRVEFLNDIRGFPDESLYPELAASKEKLIVMHFISDLDKAVRVPKSPREVFDSINSFFNMRLPKLLAAGISKDRIIIDPGMGFFLASNPEPSLAVLAHLSEFRVHFGFPVMIGISRKSFLKNLEMSDECDIHARTLAAELFAAEERVDYIRTHDARQLRQSLLVIEGISRSDSVEKPFS